MCDFKPKKCICKEFYCTTLFKRNLHLKYRILVETYSDHALSDTTCRDWFRHFKNNDFEVKDKEQSGTA